MIAEVALMEIALGPLGGANALRAALMRVRNIPIFIPGAVGGLGGFYRIGKAGQKIWSYSSEKLGIALIKAGKVRGAGQDAHHIVAGGHKWAEESRKILAKFGIKLDEAVNGVFLPATRESPNPLGSIVHRTLSNNKAYYDKVYEALKGLNSRDEVIAELRKIADALTNGTFL